MPIQSCAFRTYFGLALRCVPAKDSARWLELFVLPQGWSKPKVPDSRIKCRTCAPGRIRTCDHRIRSSGSFCEEAASFMPFR